MKVYEYKNCGTCRKALKYLDNHKIPYEKAPIRETPPSVSELKKMLKFLDGESRKLFNTSGGDYKQMNLKDRLKEMTLEEQLNLLASNGNLVKRPFILGRDFGLVGFKEEDWDRVFLK